MLFPPFPGSPSQLGPTTVAGAVRGGQIITFGLAFGVVMITIVAATLAVAGGGDDDRQQDDRPPGATGPVFLDRDDIVLPLIGLGVAALAGVAAVVVPGILRQQAVQRLATAGQPLPTPLGADTQLPPAGQQLVQATTSATLVSQALLEGAAVINAVLLIVSPQLVLLIPIAIAVFGIVVQVPTVAKVSDWLESVRQ